MKTIMNLDFNKVEEFSVVLFSLEYKILGNKRVFIYSIVSVTEYLIKKQTIWFKPLPRKTVGKTNFSLSLHSAVHADSY